MQLVGNETCPPPDDPVLSATALALNEAGYWAEILDRDWCGVYLTDEARWMFGARVELAPYPVGAHFLGPDRVREAMAWRAGQFPLEILRSVLTSYGPWILADTPGGHDELGELVDPRLRDLVEGIDAREPAPASSFRFRGIYTAAGAGVDVLVTVIRLHDDSGRFVGTVLMHKPSVGMSVLMRMTAMGDVRHFKRMDDVATPARRSAAILFADLESSSPLGRRLSTAGYFTLIRRIARAADHSVVEAGGLAGSHAGDGVVAFFLADTAGSESAAARAGISAARAIRDAIPDIAAGCDLTSEDVVMRFGLHWGANLYVGQITTSARAEVTALGDQVNETARIEACATGGRTLASKDIMERLQRDDATALGLDPSRMTYTALADLPSVTEKARRDAPALAVCEV